MDKTVPIPLHYQLKTIIEDEIDKGSYPVGSMIPTELELSAMFKISRTTVRQAISSLVNEKRLSRVKGKGTFVSSPVFQLEYMNKLQFPPYSEVTMDHNYTTKTEVLDFRIVDMPEPMQAISHNWTGKAILLYRRRFVNDDPVVCYRTYLNAEKCHAILGHDFTVEKVSEILSADEDTRICRVSRVCEAVAADKEDSELLSIHRGKPIQFITTIGYNIKNEVIEYSLSRFRGDKNKFHVELSL